MRTLLVFTELNQKFGALSSQHGLASISAFLKANGFPEVYSSHFISKKDLLRWPEELQRIKPDVVGFYVSAEQIGFIKELIDQTPPGIFTIIGGPHPTCYPDCIEEISRLDALCVGEGERPMLALAQALQSGGDVTAIPGLRVRSGGKIITTPTGPFLDKLDDLPFEDRELFATQEAINEYGLSQVRVMTSRGCPYHCTYCSNKRISDMQSGPYVRFRSADNILRELKMLTEKYKFKEIFFDDDIFMMNKKVRAEFCERYPKEIGKPFVFCGRVEMVEGDMLAQLKKAGGRRIDFGLESGNEELRRTVLKRNMTNQQIVDAVAKAKAAGLRVKTLNMVGLPEETPETAMDTVRLNQQIQPDVVSISVFCPYPGTELFDLCLEKGYFDPHAPLPKKYISRRGSLLTMPKFSKHDIALASRRFGYRVFKGYAPLKAFAYLVLYSRYGEVALAITSKIRGALQKVVSGF